MDMDKTRLTSVTSQVRSGCDIVGAVVGKAERKTRGLALDDWRTSKCVQLSDVAIWTPTQTSANYTDNVT